MENSTPKSTGGQNQTGKSLNNEISVVSDFTMGYHNHEDITNLKPGVLVVGSQNVLIDTASRVQVREGYAVDGEASTVNAPILSSFDWNSKYNGERHVRFGFLTSAGSNGKLQYRYQTATGGVIYLDLATGIANPTMNFTTFWDTTELLREMLYVNGDNSIREWNGAYAQVTSVASGSVTLASSVALYGFYNTSSAKQKILNSSNATGGILYSYTGATGNVLSGVTPNPQLSVASGNVITQGIYTYPLTSATSGPISSYNAHLISTLQNQVFVGSLTSPTYYMSKTNNYANYAQSSPRIPSDGFTATLDDNLVSFIPQESDMYISAGKDFIYTQKFTQSTAYNGAAAQAITTETAVVSPLKIAPQQAPQSQAMTTKFKNFVAMVTNEPNIDVLGRIENVLATPQTHDLSHEIKTDMDSYDFTNGSVYYWRKYLLVAVPSIGIIRMYNFATNQWEAPQTLPVTRFFTVNGELYGHSALTSETYKLFTGNSDRVINGVGSPYLAQANFSYQNYGNRTNEKSGNEFYIEGYISSNTTLNGTINYDLDGCQTVQTFTIDGSDTSVVCIPSDESSFGKVSLGKEKLGGDKGSTLTGLPPKFRVIKTFPRINFYEHQFSFSIFGKDQNFLLLAFGTNSTTASDTNFSIKQ